MALTAVCLGLQSLPPSQGTMCSTPRHQHLEYSSMLNNLVHFIWAFPIHNYFPGVFLCSNIPLTAKRKMVLHQMSLTLSPLNGAYYDLMTNYYIFILLRFYSYFDFRGDIDIYISGRIISLKSLHPQLSQKKIHIPSRMQLPKCIFMIYAIISNKRSCSNVFITLSFKRKKKRQ